MPCFPRCPHVLCNGTQPHMFVWCSLAPLAKELYVDPTELDCIGKHLFCFSCIREFLENQGCTNKCPVCNTAISKKRRDQILTAGCVMCATAASPCVSVVCGYKRSEVLSHARACIFLRFKMKAA